MSYAVHWLVPERIIYISTWGVVTADELASLLDESIMMREITHKTFKQNNPDQPVPIVHNIIDTLHITRHPINIIDVQKVFGSRRGQLKHPGWSTFISTSKVLDFLGSVALQFMNLRMRPYSTVEDGLQFLVEVDETLPSLEEMLSTYQTLSRESSIQS